MENKIYPLKTHQVMRELVNRHYEESRHAKESGKKVVWCVGQAPTDIMVAFDMIPIFPENHAAMCASRRKSVALCEIAEAVGYSIDLCSYARNDLGCAMSNGRGSPTGGLPKPDLLFATNMCNTHIKWFEALSRFYNVPLLLLDTPFIHDNLSRDELLQAMNYTRQQLEEQIAFLEQLTGRRFDYDRLRESIRLSSRAAQLFRDVIEMARQVPSPVTAFDIFFQIGPLMDMRGFPQAVAHYKQLKTEVSQRVEQHFSAIGEERYRLYWDNIPIWFRLGYLARYFASYGACIVTALYPFGWIDVFSVLDPAKPLESIAEAQNGIFLNRGARYRIDRIEKMVKEFHIDGLVVQASRTCKAYLPDQDVIIKAISQQSSIPYAIIEGDMADWRFYSDTDTERRISSLIDMLAEKARTGTLRH